MHNNNNYTLSGVQCNSAHSQQRDHKCQSQTLKYKSSTKTNHFLQSINNLANDKWNQIDSLIILHLLHSAMQHVSRSSLTPSLWFYLPSWVPTCVLKGTGGTVGSRVNM